MPKTQYYDSTGLSVTDPTRIKVPAGAINSPADIDLTEEGPGGYVQYAAADSATENVFQIPDADSHLKDSILAQNAGATVVTATGALRATTNLIGGEAVVASAAGTTVLTVASAGTQVVTGVTTQTFTLPIVTTLLQAGVTYRIVNKSTGAVTVNSSGANAVQVIAAGGTAWVTNNKITADTTAAAWDVTYIPANIEAGNQTSNIGYLNIPQQVFTDAYPIVLADSGKHLYHPASDANARQVTIPANGTIPFPIGSAITIVNDSANDVTVVITTDVLKYADVGTITTLTIPTDNQATILKVLSTQWNAAGTAGCTTA